MRTLFDPNSYAPIPMPEDGLQISPSADVFYLQDGFFELENPILQGENQSG